MSSYQSYSYSAGILPFTIDKKGNVLFLLGLDQNGWSDFGGHCEIEDNRDPRTTAAREFYEETCGSVMNICAAQFIFYKNPKPLLVQSKTLNGSIYYSYVLKIDYKDYRDIYKKIITYLQHIKISNRHIEKKEIRWVSIDDIERGTINLRGVFKRTFDEHSEKIKNYIFSNSLKS